MLGELTRIIETTDYDDIVWNGDLNWHPSRNTGFSKEVKRFVDRTGLVPVWKIYPVDYTHIHTDMVSTSVLDHFLVTERLVPLIEVCKVLHSGDNMNLYHYAVRRASKSAELHKAKSLFQAALA